MKVQIFNNRYVWIYLNFDYKRGEAELTMFVSPAAEAVHLETIPTPYEYHLTRNNIRYILHSEVQLSQQKAVQIAGMMYESEFVLAPKFKMKIANGK